MPPDAADIRVPESLRRSNERTIGQLVAQVTEDVSVIVRKELQLAKTEITSQLGIAGRGAGMLVGAAVVALYGLGILFIALSLVIAIWLPAWAGFLIVAAMLVAAALVGLLVPAAAKRTRRPTTAQPMGARSA